MDPGRGCPPDRPGSQASTSHLLRKDDESDPPEYRASDSDDGPAIIWGAKRSQAGLASSIACRRKQALAHMHPYEGNRMRLKNTLLLTILALGLGACTRHEVDSNAREAGREAREAGREIKEGSKSAAKETGKVAHEVAEETKEAAEKIGRGLKKAGKEMKEGWDEAAEKSRTAPEKK